ncbi:MAG: SDR family NAD(P)-dependent oxidoreductase [Sphingomonadales bacterium]|nr:SDR family NAD(P)-dependent oxidoreductase [Sphingomonadales bacterium]
MAETRSAPNGAILVTGAARGLGAATALALADAGYEPILLGRSLASLEATKDAVESGLGFTPRIIAADVSNWAELDRAVALALKDGEQLTGLVNNAGVIEPIDRVEDCDPAAWARCIQINLIGAFNALHVCLPRTRAGGALLNLTSGAAGFELVGWSAYAASKAGLDRLSATLAAERPDLRVLSVIPGMVDTDMQAEIRASHVDNPVRNIKREQLQPVSVPAQAIASLFGSDASFDKRIVDTRELVPANAA